MRLSRRQLLSATLFGVGMAPVAAMPLFVASGFVAPEVFRAVFALFVPSDLDAPDNWAVAITRIVHFFSVAVSVGIVFVCLVLWTPRRRRGTDR